MARLGDQRLNGYVAEYFNGISWVAHEIVGIDGEHQMTMAGKYQDSAGYEQLVDDFQDLQKFVRWMVMVDLVIVVLFVILLVVIM